MLGRGPWLRAQLQPCWVAVLPRQPLRFSFGDPESQVWRHLSPSWEGPGGISSFVTLRSLSHSSLSFVVVAKNSHRWKPHLKAPPVLARWASRICALACEAVMGLQPLFLACCGDLAFGGALSRAYSEAPFPLLQGCWGL